MENNNNKNLVTGVDDDPTAELEILSHSLRIQDADEGLESDANTFNYADDTVHIEAPSAQIEMLRLDIRERDECINRLQFDIEQLRSRWNGLNTEIKVREKLTDNVNAALRKATNDLEAAQRKLRDSQAAAELLVARIGEIENANDEAGTLIESLRDASAQRDKRVAELDLQNSRYEQELRELRVQLGALQSESTARDLELQARDREFRDLSQTLLEANNQSNTLAKELAGRDAALVEKSAETEQLHQLLAQSRNDLAALQEVQAATAASTLEVVHDPATADTHLTAEESGLLADSRQEIHDLQSQVGRTEAYADSLRIKLQTQSRIAEEATKAREQTDLLLADARQQISEVAHLLECEKQSSAGLRDQIDAMKSEFDDEIARMQSELQVAQKAIADHETILEQLTSDLFDSQSFRQVLESQLEKTEESSEELNRSLRQKIKRLEHQHEDDRQKISNKDGAIAALLNELANRSSAEKVAGEAESTASDESDYMPDVRHDEKSVADRTTRLLIGSIDGQELRFPLFKDKLTIGRTKNNDIHLKAQYISRRHALIVTENESTKIIDWGSKNGVSVNKRPVTEQVLRSGDIVTIGNADFRYEERPKR